MSRRRSEERMLENMKREVERLSKKVNYMETGKKWDSGANEKQFLFVTKVKEILVEDLRLVLEEEFQKRGGEVPASIKDIVKKGEKELDLIAKMLRLGDKASWEAVNNNCNIFSNVLVCIARMYWPVL